MTGMKHLCKQMELGCWSLPGGPDRGYHSEKTWLGNWGIYGAVCDRGGSRTPRSSVQWAGGFRAHKTGLCQRRSSLLILGGLLCSGSTKQCLCCLLGSWGALPSLPGVWPPKPQMMSRHHPPSLLVIFHGSAQPVFHTSLGTGLAGSHRVLPPRQADPTALSRPG